MNTYGESLHAYLLKERALKHCEISISEDGTLWIRSTDYINVFAPLDLAGRLFGYRVTQRGRDFERPSQSYFVRMEKVKS